MHTLPLTLTLPLASSLPCALTLPLMPSPLLSCLPCPPSLSHPFLLCGHSGGVWWDVAGHAMAVGGQWWGWACGGTMRLTGVEYGTVWC
jgi:hypothetical protein